jgi:hypothetical protein
MNANPAHRCEQCPAPAYLPPRRVFFFWRECYEAIL